MSPVDVIPIMDEVMAWLRANEIEPTDVPITAVPQVTDKDITCPVYLRRDGRKYIDEATGDAARGTVTVPLKRQPPDTLLPWLNQNATP